MGPTAPDDRSTMPIEPPSTARRRLRVPFWLRLTAAAVFAAVVALAASYALRKMNL